MIEVKERPKSRSGNTALQIRKIGVIGAGQMGSGIAHVSALAGFDVKLNDLSADRIKAGIATINGNMAHQGRGAADGAQTHHPGGNAGRFG
jgi:3-hydroxyacyl-CoA dehydrogenase